MTGTNFESDDDSELPSQSHPPLATAFFGGIGTVILGVLAVVALLGFGVFKVIQKKLSGSKTASLRNSLSVLLLITHRAFSSPQMKRSSLFCRVLEHVLALGLAALLLGEITFQN